MLAPEANSKTAGNTTTCKAWRERIYKRHNGLASFLKFKHGQIAKSKGYVAANQWLTCAEKSLKIGASGMYCDSSDQQITDYAEAKSKKIEQQICQAFHTIGASTQSHKERICSFIRIEVQKAGVEYPLTLTGYTNQEMIAAFARVCDPVWWRRQIRKIAARQFEDFARSSGMVSFSNQIYCSDTTLRRRVEQKKRNRKLLESLEAENSAGQVYTLAELSDLSVSNPVNKRHELMTRISGFEEYAKNSTHVDELTSEEVNFVGIFPTLTAPSKYHPKTTRKTRDGITYAIPNSKFAGFTARDTNDYLCGVWAGIRAEWARRNIHPFGFRMVEPHHDGTPHWHMVLFLPENRLIEASYVFNHYAKREDGDEYGADRARSTIVYIDPAKGSAAGYCAKYVAKNIDGFSLESDLYGRDALRSAMRIEAWASTNGIRQFQQIGGPSVTVYREARRIKIGELVLDIDDHARKIIDAADSGDWESYTTLMGGAICKLEDRPIRPQMISREEENKYGEFSAVLAGLITASSTIPTRNETWVIRPVKNTPSETCDDSWSSSLRGFSTSPKVA